MAEIESVLVVYGKVVEVVVVGCLYDFKGQGIYIYVMLNQGFLFSFEIYEELRQWVCKEIGLVVFFDWIQFVCDLLKI